MVRRLECIRTVAYLRVTMNMAMMHLVSFNLISGYSDPPIWNKFIVAPLNLREKIMELIDREIEFAKQGEEAYIIGKMNSLLDKEVIAKLYEASAAVGSHRSYSSWYLYTKTWYCRCQR